MDKASSFRNLIDIKLWKALQDKFASISDFYISAVDMGGEEIIISGKKPFLCQIISRKKPELCRKCRKENVSGSWGPPKKFYCKCGLLNIISPVYIGKTKVGGIIFNSIKESDFQKAKLNLIALSKEIGIDESELIEELEKIHISNVEEIAVAKKLIEILANTVPEFSHKGYVDKKEISKLKLIHSFSRTLNYSLEINKIANFAIEFFIKDLKVDECSLYLMDINKRYCSKNLAERAFSEVESLLFNHIQKVKNYIRVLDLSTEFTYKHINGVNALKKSVLSLPLKTGSRLLGSVNLYYPKNQVITREQLEFLDLVADQLSMALMNSISFHSMEQSATTDTLTGLNNRKQFSEILNREISRSASSESPVSFAIFDIDNFKRYNDTYGHAEGDKVLREMAETAKENIRSIDTICRYGGEEFVVILPETKADEAYENMEKLRTAVEQKDLGRGENPVTISIGLVTCLNCSASDKVMIEEADKALYKAKAEGKNRTVSRVIIDKNMNPIDVQDASRLGKALK